MEFSYPPDSPRKHLSSPIFGIWIVGCDLELASGDETWVRLVFSKKPFGIYIACDDADKERQSLGIDFLEQELLAIGPR